MLHAQKFMAADLEAKPERKVLVLEQRELTLLRDHTYVPRELLALPIKLGRTYKVYLSQEEADELLGYIAAEAGHSNEKKLGVLFDALYEKVREFEQSFRS
jgi:hypothetical protein